MPPSTCQSNTNHSVFTSIYDLTVSMLALVRGRLYLDILGRQREVVSGNEGRYRGGLQKLADTEKVVADLQERLTEMKPFLEKAAKYVTADLSVCAHHA